MAFKFHIIRVAAVALSSLDPLAWLKEVGKFSVEILMLVYLLVG
jgi:hypothetical protein